MNEHHVPRHQNVTAQSMSSSSAPPLQHWGVYSAAIVLFKKKTKVMPIDVEIFSTVLTDIDRITTILYCSCSIFNANW